jgi:hypothetical protein
MKRVLAFVAFVALSSFCYADWYLSAASISSENGKYKATISERPNGTNELEVTIAATKRPLWRKYVEWKSGYVGLLSNDGNVFAVVNSDYDPEQGIVFIYDRSTQAAYSVKNIKVDEYDLIESGSKDEWISLQGDNVSYIYDANGAPEYLELKIITGKIVQIKLK